MSEFPKMNTDPDAVGKIVGTIGDIGKKFKEGFGKRAEEAAKNQNLSAAQHGDTSHYEFISKMMEQSHGHDVRIIREQAKAARSMAKLAAATAGVSKPGTKKTVQFGADGAAAISHTTGAAPRKPRNTAATKPAASKVGRPAAQKPAAKKANPANPARGGKK